LDARDYRVWGYLASTYYHGVPGKRDKAQSLYKQAAKLAEAQRDINPRDPKVLADLAGYYAVLGERGKAVSLMTRALALAPDDLEVMVSAGDTYEQLGERERALHWIRKALEHGYPPKGIERMPGLEQLRADARFQHLLKRSGSKP